MKVLLFGKRGQVGWELQRALAPVAEIIALGREDSSPLCGDLTDLQRIEQAVIDVRPDAIVNAAAYTAVDRAESEPDLATVVNASGPGVLAQAAQRCGAWLVHYSTDYVFDGSGTTAWKEDDRTGPLNVYGRTKLEGERLIRTAGCRHLVFRTSWVFSSHGDNFARTMLRLASERDQLQVVDDQYGAPTGAELIADATVHALLSAMRQPELAGTYHLVASGETNWYGYARRVIERARIAGKPLRVDPDGIRPVRSSTFRTTASRPANSRLDNRKVRQAFSILLPHWTVGVDRMLAEVLHDRATTSA